MKHFALIALGLCLAAASFACADEWSKTYTITGKPDLRVETSDANIHVDTWDQKTIEARVTSEHYKIGEHGLRIEEHQIRGLSRTGNPFSVRRSHHQLRCAQPRVDVEIHMPREGKCQSAYRGRFHPPGKFQRRNGSADRRWPSGY